MPKVLVVTGSVRVNSVNEKIVPVVVSEVEKLGATAVVADLKVLDLPFYNDEHQASSPDFAPTHEGVKEWTQLVAGADAVVLVTPEYNHTMTPVQLNAIDWIYKEWDGKPVGFVGYGWRSGAGQAQATAREALAVNLKAIVGDDQTNLFFTKDLDPSGAMLDEQAVREKIATTIREVLAYASTSRNV